MIIGLNLDVQIAQQTFVALNSQLGNRHRQTQKQRAARDMLLPRLMSGEVAV